MAKQFLPLTIALASLCALAAFAALLPGSTPHPKPGYLSSAVGQPKMAAQAAPRAADLQAEAAEPATEATNVTGQKSTRPAAKTAGQTGCGKHTPCPNKSCEDCPFNIYLKQ